MPVSIKLTEHDEYVWIFPAEADRYNITEQTKKIIKLVAETVIFIIYIKKTLLPQIRTMPIHS